MQTSNVKLDLLNRLMQQFSNLPNSDVAFGVGDASLAQTTWAKEALQEGYSEYLAGCDSESCLEYWLFMERFGSARVWNKHEHYLMYIWGPELTDDDISFDDLSLDLDSFIVFACLRHQTLGIDYAIDRTNGKVVRAMFQNQLEETDGDVETLIQPLDMTFLEWLEAYVTDSTTSIFNR